MLLEGLHKQKNRRLASYQTNLSRFPFSQWPGAQELRFIFLFPSQKRSVEKVLTCKVLCSACHWHLMASNILITYFEHQVIVLHQPRHYCRKRTCKCIKHALRWIENFCTTMSFIKAAIFSSYCQSSRDHSTSPCLHKQLHTPEDLEQM